MKIKNKNIPKIKLKMLKDKKEDSISIKPFNILKVGLRINPKRLYNWYMDTKHSKTVVLINLELMNGFHDSFIVKEDEDGFTRKSKKYVFDNELKYYNMTAKLWCYDFHENLTLPVQRVIPMSRIKKSLETSINTEVEYAINPATLERFLTAKIAEGIMKGQEMFESMQDFLKQFRIILIIVAAVTIVHLLLFINASGMLENVKLPF